MVNISKDCALTYVLTFVFIQLVHLTSVIWIIDGPNNNDAGFFARIVISLIIHVAVNTVLHFAFCVKGRVEPVALPLMWAMCIFTLVIYCFYFMSADFGNWGPGLPAFILGSCLLAPALAISIFTCVIFYIVKWLRR